ncbi:MAG: UDP-N-acetylmuramoyl-tripeptide--D-alanyl-D-alanine ligase, partial [Clostridia bacterium]|nr:UDP-N-acetylmuramoyl-tripeptide--D-alanyl-D-alanine ligase [Clostridia bacterium]
MKPFLLSDALRAVNGRWVGDEKALSATVTGVTSDSRAIAPGALFIALKGSRVDGHDFMA